MSHALYGKSENKYIYSQRVFAPWSSNVLYGQPGTNVPSSIAAASSNSRSVVGQREAFSHAVFSFSCNKFYLLFSLNPSEF